MNILYLAHRIPYPPNKGDKIRSFHQIRHLARKHSVYLACLIDDPDDVQHVGELRRFCRAVEVAERTQGKNWWRMVLAFARAQPFSIGAFVLPELQKKIVQLCRRTHIDRIFVFSSPMAEYVKDMTSIPIIMDFVDMRFRKVAGLCPNEAISSFRTLCP